MRRTLLCWHHCFKFSGNDRLRNRDGGFGTCCWTLVRVKLCWFRYWYTVIMSASLILPNVVSFFYKNELKTICNRIQNCDWIVLFFIFAMNTTQVDFESLFLRQLSATNRAFVVLSILFDYFYIEWAHIIIYITVRTWIQCKRSREPVGEVKIKLCAPLASQRIHFTSQWQVLKDPRSHARDRKQRRLYLALIFECTFHWLIARVLSYFFLDCFA